MKEELLRKLIEAKEHMQRLTSDTPRGTEHLDPIFQRFLEIDTRIRSYIESVDSISSEELLNTITDINQLLEEANSFTILDGDESPADSHTGTHQVQLLHQSSQRGEILSALIAAEVNLERGSPSDLSDFLETFSAVNQEIIEVSSMTEAEASKQQEVIEDLVEAANEFDVRQTSNTQEPTPPPEEQATSAALPPLQNTDSEDDHPTESFWSYLLRCFRFFHPRTEEYENPSSEEDGAYDNSMRDTENFVALPEHAPSSAMEDQVNGSSSSSTEVRSLLTNPGNSLIGCINVQNDAATSQLL